MHRIFGLIAIITFALFATPLAAQQDTAQQRPGADTLQDTTMAGMEADTAPMGQMEAGEEMPTTASPLPVLALAGAVLVGVGLAIRYARRS